MTDDPIDAPKTAEAAPTEAAIVTLSERDSLPFTISLRKVNLGVGYTATFLPLAVWLAGYILGTCRQNNGMTSISHYYYTPLGGDILVGALCLIGALMLVFFSVPDPIEGDVGLRRVDEYHRFGQRDLRLAKLAGAMAFLIAFSPASGSGCAVDGDALRAYVLTPAELGRQGSGPLDWAPQKVAFDLSAFSVLPWTSLIHGLASGVMFVILGYFSLFVFTRVQSEKSLKTATSTGFRKKLRNAIYILSGLVIFGAIAAMLFKFVACFGPDACAYDDANLTFWVETCALMAFGFSWLTKGRFIRWLADPA